MTTAGLMLGFLAAAAFSEEFVRPEIRAGSELEFPPYAFVDDKGEPAGFSVDLIRAVAANMGLTAKSSTGTWNAVWNDLGAGRRDVLPIVAKLPERTRVVDFSVPHTETYDAFFVREGAPLLSSLAGAGGREIVVMRSDAPTRSSNPGAFKGTWCSWTPYRKGCRLGETRRVPLLEGHRYAGDQRAWDKGLCRGTGHCRL